MPETDVPCAGLSVVYGGKAATLEFDLASLGSRRQGMPELVIDVQSGAEINPNMLHPQFPGVSADACTMNARYANMFTYTCSAELVGDAKLQIVLAGSPDLGPMMDMRVYYHETHCTGSHQVCLL